MSHAPAQHGMSDEQRRFEKAAQREIKKAVDDLREAILFSNSASSLFVIDAESFENFVHDEIPTKEQWDEKIRSARK